MTLKLGRAGTGPPIPQVDTWAANGDRVTVSTLFAAANQTEAQVLRQQLLGLADNPDEPVVPVVWSDNPRVDGFYRVLSAATPLGPGEATAAMPNVSFTVELERLLGYAYPQIESLLEGSVAANDHSKTTSTSPAWHSVPVSAWGHSKMALGSVPATREAEGSDVLFIPGIAYGTTVSYWLAPADWYKASATLLVGAPLTAPSGAPPSTALMNSTISAMFAASGRQIAASPSGWCVSNGVVRVAMAQGYLMVQAYDPDSNAWGTATAFIVQSSETTGSAYTSFDGDATWPFNIKQVTVVRNSPAEVVLRLSGLRSPTSTIGGTDMVTCDLSLRRGSRAVRMLLFAPNVLHWRTRFNTTTASTAVTGGIRSNANDADGNRWAIFSSKTATADTTLGWMTKQLWAADLPLDFGIAAEVGGTGAASPNQAAQLIDEYLAAHTESIVVVGR